jgi:hypothetical protein
VRFRFLAGLITLVLTQVANASPFIASGDLALRQDIQRLADYGIIHHTVTTWPLAWGPLLVDLKSASAADLPPAIADALIRLRAQAERETRVADLRFKARLSVAEKPARIRSFQATPRGNVDVSAGLEWTGEWLSVDLNGQYVDSDQDDEEFRVDDSYVGVIAGNWSFGASTLQRWWGPAWDGSLILSNNARPFPSITIDRMFTDAFETKWLSWLGPWDLNVSFGQLEEERAVPNAQVFGMRFNFRPIPSLEIGLSRSAQWCGDGRPCDLSTFVDLLLGRDNRGDEGIDPDNEPGNQLAGVDFRWVPPLGGRPVAVYGQFIGEDEAGGFPSRWMGQFGTEWSGYWFGRWSSHAFLEFSGTSCQFHESSEIFNCAYNHGIYQTGYRYRRRSIGHGADNDARIVSAGLSVVDADESQWHLLLRYGKLNRGGPPDDGNTLTPTPQDTASIDVTHSRLFRFGQIEIGIGVEAIDDDVTSTSTEEFRGFLQWRSAH